MTGPLDRRPSELLYGTTDPYEEPLIMPAWVRSIPMIAKRIDDGYELRRSAGRPIAGSLPGCRSGFAESERRAHRCDERCACPGDGLPLFYAPSTGRHACQDPCCEHAHPDGD